MNQQSKQEIMLMRVAALKTADVPGRCHCGHRVVLTGPRRESVTCSCACHHWQPLDECEHEWQIVAIRSFQQLTAELARVAAELGWLLHDDTDYERVRQMNEHLHVMLDEITHVRGLTVDQDIDAP